MPKNALPSVTWPGLLHRREMGRSLIRAGFSTPSTAHSSDTVMLLVVSLGRSPMVSRMYFSDAGIVSYQVSSFRAISVGTAGVLAEADLGEHIAGDEPVAQ